MPALLPLLLSAALAAEPSPALTWTVQVDPFTFALGYAHLQVERALSPLWSVYAGPHLRLFDGLLTLDPEPYRGYGVEIGARRFLRSTAPEGGWVLARGVIAVAHTEVPAPTTAPGGYVSALIGYTAVLGPGLVLSGGTGVQYIHYTVGDYGVQGFVPALHTALGWAW